MDASHVPLGPYPMTLAGVGMALAILMGRVPVEFHRGPRLPGPCPGLYHARGKRGRWKAWRRVRG